MLGPRSGQRHAHRKKRPRSSYCCIRSAHQQKNDVPAGCSGVWELAPHRFHPISRGWRSFRKLRKGCRSLSRSSPVVTLGFRPAASPGSRNRSKLYQHQWRKRGLGVLSFVTIGFRKHRALRSQRPYSPSRNDSRRFPGAPGTHRSAPGLPRVDQA